MEAALALSIQQYELEDPLAHLPHSTVLQYKKGHTIYDANLSLAGLYLVIEGRVKISRSTECGNQVITDIYGPDEFFGEAAIVGVPHRSEQATTLETTRLMTWRTPVLQDIISRRPRLAVALLQAFVQRTLEFKDRIESLTVDPMPRRLARTLIRLSERLGAPQDDGSVRMQPLTHELLSQHVGTTREAITQQMNRFRRQGFVCYTRRDMVLYRGAFKEWLRQNL
jgi:CRP/FNR family transcriptional regulator